MTKITKHNKKLNLKNRAKKASEGKLSSEEAQHLRRLGVAITNKTKSPSKRPIRRFAAWWETTAIEKLLEDISFLLKNAALLEIVNLVAGITIIISLITWLATEKQRRNGEVYQAWQVVTAAYNQPGSGGRKEALEFLNSEPRRFPWFWLKWEKQSLAGLAAPKAYLRGTELQQAYLVQANLQDAWLEMANLQKVHLEGANLQNAWLPQANLQEADLRGANLQEAELAKANLQEAELFKANFQEAKLWQANLQEASLWKANLQEAYLVQANLQETNLVEVEKLTSKQIKSACYWEKAMYKGEWNHEKQSFVAIEPDNTKFIEELKKDKSSDPEEPIDCTFWEWWEEWWKLQLQQRQQRYW